MKKDNKKTGNKGEDLAADFLENKGYLIIERNFRTRFGEIDIVCLDGQILVFVEVKTKIGHNFGEPEDMVSKSKLAQVRRMGEVFMTTKIQNIQNSKNQNNVMPDSIRHPETTGLPRFEYETRNDGDGFRVVARNDRVWKGQCRVDVVGIVLQVNGEMEIIRHHEAVY